MKTTSARKNRNDDFKEKLRQKISDDSKRQETKNSYFDISNFDNINFFKPADGNTYEIDILPFEITSNKHPFGLKKGEPDYVLDVWVHYDIGIEKRSLICSQKTFNRRCPVCDEVNSMRNNDSIDKDFFKNLTPKRRCIYNVIDLNEKEKGVQIFDVSYFLFQKELIEEAQAQPDEVVCFADLEDGKSIKFRASEEQIKGMKFIKFKSLRFIDRKPYSDNILDSVYPLDAMLIIPDYEETKKYYLGQNELGFDEDEISEINRPIRKRKFSSYDEQEKKIEIETNVETEYQCPHDLKFGINCDENKFCRKCEIWDKCAAVFDKNFNEITE